MKTTDISKRLTTTFHNRWRQRDVSFTKCGRNMTHTARFNACNIYEHKLVFMNQATDCMSSASNKAFAVTLAHSRILRKPWVQQEAPEARRLVQRQPWITVYTVRIDSNLLYAIGHIPCWHWRKIIANYMLKAKLVKMLTRTSTRHTQNQLVVSILWYLLASDQIAYKKLIMTIFHERGSFYRVRTAVHAKLRSCARSNTARKPRKLGNDNCD